MTDKLVLMKERYPIGKVVRGKVTMLTPFGMFLDLQDSDFIGLIEIIHIPINSKGYENYNAFYPPLMSIVEAKVLGYKPENSQIYLSMKD